MTMLPPRAMPTSTTSALALFDSLPTVAITELTSGLWRGSGVPTGHPQDGMLEALGWYGKRFTDAEDVHPLLFGERDRLIDVDTRWLPAALIRVKTPPGLVAGAWKLLRGALHTTLPGARLRIVEHRGKHTAAMIYDQLPIIDVFRKLGDDSVLGLMDQRDVAQPFFFRLDRDER